jgi:hypothetical protein
LQRGASFCVHCSIEQEEHHPQDWRENRDFPSLLNEDLGFETKTIKQLFKKKDAKLQLKIENALNKQSFAIKMSKWKVARCDCPPTKTTKKKRVNLQSSRYFACSQLWSYVVLVQAFTLQSLERVLLLRRDSVLD